MLQIIICYIANTKSNKLNIWSDVNFPDLQSLMFAQTLPRVKGHFRNVFFDCDSPSISRIAVTIFLYYGCTTRSGYSALLLCDAKPRLLSYPVFRHSIERGQTIVVLLEVLTVFINNQIHISDSMGQKYVQAVQHHMKRVRIVIYLKKWIYE